MSRLENDTHIGEQKQIKEEFLDEQFLAPEIEKLTLYTDIVNYLVSGVISPDANY